MYLGDLELVSASFTRSFCAPTIFMGAPPSPGSAFLGSPGVPDPEPLCLSPQVICKTGLPISAHKLLFQPKQCVAVLFAESLLAWGADGLARLIDHVIALAVTRGELMPRRLGHGWAINRHAGRSYQKATDSMEELIADVVTFAEKHREARKRVGRPFDKKRIFCGVFLSDRPDPPGFSINSDLLTRIGVLELDLDIDIV